MGTSVRKMYDAELLQLDTMLARMGHAALRTGDTELARSVIARDSEIDSAEHEIEHRCLTLFLRQQPVAGDLRKVSTALKMVTDIERIADQASDIAEITLHLHPDGARTVGVLDDLYAMGDIALHMVKDAIAAYVQVDLSTAAQVIARDDDCDAMFSRISKEIAAYIAAHPGDAETALDLFMIDKYLERLGDHAVNLTENAQEFLDRSASLSPTAHQELMVLREVLGEILDYTYKAFAATDYEAARHIEPVEEVVDDLVATLRANHIRRVRDGQCTVYAGLTFLDILVNVERIADQCSNVGVFTLSMFDEHIMNNHHDYIQALHQGKDPVFNRAYQEAHDKYFGELKRIERSK